MASGKDCSIDKFIGSPRAPAEGGARERTVSVLDSRRTVHAGVHWIVHSDSGGTPSLSHVKLNYLRLNSNNLSTTRGVSSLDLCHSTFWFAISLVRLSSRVDASRCQLGRRVSTHTTALQVCASANEDGMLRSGRRGSSAWRRTSTARFGAVGSGDRCSLE
jgi:hypothetical protein